MTGQPRRAMTMREIREALGHQVPPSSVPEADVLPTAFVVSCLPEGHDDRLTYTVNVQYRSHDRYVVRQRLQYADATGTWSYEPDFDEDDAGEEKWFRTRSFDLTAALRLARRIAPTLTYRGRTVADVLAEAVQR